MIDELVNDNIKTIMVVPSYPRGYHGQGGVAHTASNSTKRHSYSQREELNDFIASIPQGGSVLDVGCGEGRALYRIKEQRPDIHLWGVDISDVSSLLPSGAHFTQGSAEELTNFYEANTFDAVICRNIIDHLVSPLNLVSGIREVLRPGGRVFMETPNWTRLFMPFSFLYFWNDYTHIHPYTPFSMRRMLLEHNFSVESLHTLSSCKWHLPARLRKPKAFREDKSSPEFLLSSFVYTHKQSGFLAKSLSFLINPLIKDLLIAIGTKN